MKKKFQKISKKKFMIQKIFLLRMKILTISFIFFANVRLEYQNILSWLFKKHHFKSTYSTVSQQEHSQKIHFTFGHPVFELVLFSRLYGNKIPCSCTILKGHKNTKNSNLNLVLSIFSIYVQKCLREIEFRSL